MNDVGWSGLECNSVFKQTAVGDAQISGASELAPHWPSSIISHHVRRGIPSCGCSPSTQPRVSRPSQIPRRLSPATLLPHFSTFFTPCTTASVASRLLSSSPFPQASIVSCWWRCAIRCCALCSFPESRDGQPAPPKMPTMPTLRCRWPKLPAQEILPHFTFQILPNQPTCGRNRRACLRLFRSAPNKSGQPLVFPAADSLARVWKLIDVLPTGTSRCGFTQLFILFADLSGPPHLHNHFIPAPRRNQVQP